VLRKNPNVKAQMKNPKFKAQMPNEWENKSTCQNSSATFELERVIAKSKTYNVHLIALST
jgi:hypothetical protein